MKLTKNELRYIITVLEDAVPHWHDVINRDVTKVGQSRISSRMAVKCLNKIEEELSK